MGKRKAAFTSLFFMACLAITVYFLFRGKDFGALVNAVKGASPWCWPVGALLVLFFIMGESVVMNWLLRNLGMDSHFTHCLNYSFAGFFFCLVTPGATGGQPFQLIMMKKDGIPVHVSSIVLLLITIAYKMVLLVFSLAVLIFHPATVWSLLDPVKGWVILGFFLTLISTGTMLLLIERPGIVIRTSIFLFNVVSRIVRSEKLTAKKEKFIESVEKYRETALFVHSHRGIILKILLMTIVQRTCLFLVTFVVFVSFGMTTLNVVETVTLQSMISTAVDMLPVPGGMGMTEHLYMRVFRPVCGEDMVLPSLLITRGLTYYTQLFITAFMMGLYFIRQYIRATGKDSGR